MRTPRHGRLAAAVTLSITIAAAVASNPLGAAPLSGPTVINVYRPGDQGFAVPAAGGNGDVVPIWSDPSRSNAVFSQRFDSSGNRVNSDDWYVLPSTWMQVKSSMDRAGSLGLVGILPDGNGQAVYAQVLTRTGAYKVQPFKVNATYGTTIYQPVIGMNPQGEFVVVWGVRTASGQQGLYGRLFSATGSALTGEIAIRPLGTVIQNPQGVALDSSRRFAPIWLTDGVWDIYTARLGPTGGTIVAPSIVNTTVAGVQAGPRIGMNAQGQTVIVWESQNQDGSGFGIYGQRLDGNGVRVGNEFVVNTATFGDQRFCNVGVADDSSFAVSWMDFNGLSGSGAPITVYARQFGANGTALASPETVVSSSGNISSHGLAMDPAGYYTVTWGAPTDAANGYDLFANRYVMATTPSIQTTLSNVVIPNLSGATGSWKYFKIDVPNGATSVKAQISGGTGDADVFVRLGSVPSATGTDAASQLAGNTEGVQINGIPPGAWYVAVYAYAGYTGLSLKVSYQ